MCQELKFAETQLVARALNMKFNPFDDSSARIRAKLYLIYALLAAANIGTWSWALITFKGNVVLFGTALVAYTFGLRHAFDADHITAIDNVVRKLVQDGKTPCSVGFFFSLGHSTIVLLATVALIAFEHDMQSRFGPLHFLGSVTGTSVSTLFLLIIALVNLFTLRGTWVAFVRLRRGEKITQTDFNSILKGGLASRVLHPFMRYVSSSWQMYAVGFLFALGFDTATEIGVLGISATQSAQGISLWSILIFPALFTAGMSLMDTTDSVLMTQVYGWAFLQASRKLSYNLLITATSVAIALYVAVIEALSLFQNAFEYKGQFWTQVVNLNNNLTKVGCAVTVLFLSGWVVAVLVSRKSPFRRSAFTQI
jgi:high-affinity nickel-transport protein